MIHQDRDLTFSHQLLLTPEAAAKLLGIGRTKVFELIGSGSLASVKIGASRRIPTEALRLFVEDLRITAASEVPGGPDPAVLPPQRRR